MVEVFEVLSFCPKENAQRGDLGCGMTKTAVTIRASKSWHTF